MEVSQASVVTLSLVFACLMWPGAIQALASADNDFIGSSGGRGFVNWLKVLNVRSCCPLQVIIEQAWIGQATLTP